MRFDLRWLVPKELRPYMTSQEAGELFMDPAAVTFALTLVLGFVVPWAGEWWWWATCFGFGAIVGHVGCQRVMKRVRARMRQERLS